MRNDPYAKPLIDALVLQTCLLLVCSLCLDGGVLLYACRYSSAAFWLGAVLVLVRRPRAPTRGDLEYIRWGLLLVISVAMPAFLWMWHVKNVI